MLRQWGLLRWFAKAANNFFTKPPKDVETVDPSRLVSYYTPQQLGNARAQAQTQDGPRFESVHPMAALLEEEDSFEGGSDGDYDSTSLEANKKIEVFERVFSKLSWDAFHNRAGKAFERPALTADQMRALC